MANLNVGIEITADDRASGPLDGLKRRLGLMDGVVVGLGMKLLDLGGQALGALKAGLLDSIEAAAESEAAHAQLEAVIASTGGAAGLTADDIDEMASKFAMLTTFEDDAVLAAQNVLLTFTNIRGEAFEPATAAILDMSTALGMDLQSATIQVGKALNDPVKGITALTRVGVSFTTEQKNVIKALVETGDVAGAQKIIIEELNKEFGGSAAAAADTYAGKQQRLKNTIGELQEEIGGKLIPILSDAIDVLLQSGDVTEDVAEALRDLDAAAGGVATSQADILVDLNALNRAWESQTNFGMILSGTYKQVEQGTRDAAAALAQTTPDYEDFLAVFEDSFSTDAQQAVRTWAIELEHAGVIGGYAVEDLYEWLTLMNSAAEAQDGWMTGLSSQRLPAVTATTSAYSSMVEEATENTEASIEAGEEHAEKLDRQAEMAERSREGQENLAKALENLAEANRESDRAMGEQFGTQLELIGATDALSDANVTSEEKFFLMLQQAGAAPEVLAAAGVQLGIFTEEQAEAALKAAILEKQIENLAGQVADGNMTWDEAWETMGVLQDRMLDETVPAVDDTTEALATQHGEMLGMVEDGPYEPEVNVLVDDSQVDEVVTAIDNIPRTVVVTVEMHEEGVGGPGGRQHGGPVWPGGAFMVGEVGPELFVPDVSGVIVPTHMLPQGGRDMQMAGPLGGGSVHNTFQFYGGQTFMAPETADDYLEQAAMMGA